MKPITKEDGSVYCYVDVDDRLLKFKLRLFSDDKWDELHLDAKIIPQLIKILSEKDNV